MGQALQVGTEQGLRVGFFDDKLEECRTALATGNALFGDSIYIFHPGKDAPFEGLTDGRTNYAYLQREGRADGRDVLIAPDRFNRRAFQMTSDFKLVVVTRKSNPDTLLRFCLQQLAGVLGFRAIDAGFDAEAIYRDEFSEDIRRDLNIVRIRFSLSVRSEIYPDCFAVCDDDCMPADEVRVSIVCRATVTAVLTPETFVVVSIEAEASLAAVVTPVNQVAAAVSAAASVSASVSIANQIDVSITAQAVLTTALSIEQFIEAAITAEGSLSAVVTPVNLISAAITAEGSASASVSINNLMSAAITAQATVAAVVVDTPAAPTAPSSLTATVAGPTQINLAWTDNATIETGYYVERSTDNANWTVIATNIAANSTTYNATGLASNTLYYFRVRCANSGVYSSYSNTASATTHTLPSDISGLQNWYDAAVGVTLADTNRVSQWNDQSGNARHATQTSAPSRPVYNSSLAAANNKPSVEFNGSAYIMNFTNAVTGTTARTIILAIKSDNASGASTQRIFNLSSGGSGTSFVITDEIGIRTGTVSWLSSTPAGSSASIVAITYSGGNLFTGVSVWKNNASVTRTGGSDGAPNTGTTGEMGTFSGSFYDGHIMEACVWNKVLSTDERQKIQTYMAAKFNITLS